MLIKSLRSKGWQYGPVKTFTVSGAGVGMGIAFAVTDCFSDNESQHSFAKIGVQIRIVSKFAKP